MPTVVCRIEGCVVRRCGRVVRICRELRVGHNEPLSVRSIVAHPRRIGILAATRGALARAGPTALVLVQETHQSLVVYPIQV